MLDGATVALRTICQSGGTNATSCAAISSTGEMVHAMNTFGKPVEA